MTSNQNSPVINPGEAVNDLRNLILDAKKRVPGFPCPDAINRLGQWLKALGDVGEISADSVLLGLLAGTEPANAVELTTARADVAEAKAALADTLAERDHFREMYEVEKQSTSKLGLELADAKDANQRLAAELDTNRKALAAKEAAAPVAAPAVTESAAPAATVDAFAPLDGVAVPQGISDEAAERTRHLRWAYTVVARHPDCTTAEMAHQLDCPLYPLRMAVRALQGANWVVSSGTRTCSVSNRSANTYRVADKDKLPRASDDLVRLMEDEQGAGADAPAPASTDATVAEQPAPVAPAVVAAPPMPAEPPAPTPTPPPAPAKKAKAPKADEPPVPGKLLFPPPNSTPVGALPKVKVYTDGACHGNPGPGGYAAVIHFAVDGQKTALRRNVTGAARTTTNNQMELMAAIAALEALADPCEVTITTDSQYVRTGITEWIARWKQNGWRTAAKKPVKNADLWRRLDTLCEKHRVSWEWVAGHNGHRWNEEADQLATNAITAMQAGTLAPIDLGSNLEDSTAAAADEMVAAPSAGTPTAGGNDVM